MNSSNEEKIEELIRKNGELNKEILAMTKYIKKYVFWQKIMGWLKLALIAIPIIFAFVYLPPFLKDIYELFQPLLDLANISNTVNQ